ncbi:serine/threonine-protein kinase PCRK2 isoform X1 [Selaginella moellendorffii]|uniref:serine/threonine-protein kinase PCRK2 isoform X1 n=1 Tax=Selaginella moellendorffii TaxID=88036 RepID=UPI000D1CE920|nr:serine/threonine-protein kinase PCRK2 isoform X1 [Selaginella moellendorffii]|eukprot:XP_024534751.1 serine/threonine-protein kinase PCRK2 isoform X1 [Selaginella moellendorffii]
MKCIRFSHSGGDKRPEARSRKSIWNLSSSGGSNPDNARRSGSEANSQTDASGSGQGSPASNFLLSSSMRQNELKVFSFAELKAATRNFHRTHWLGEGGFGCVYKGFIKVNRTDGTESKVEVAVKQLNGKGLQGHKEWLSEIRYLGVVDDPNLVKLIGYCLEDDPRGVQMLLVYEFMPKGSLEGHLFRRGPPVLPWEARVKIALGTARGLAYLHEELQIQVHDLSKSVFSLFFLLKQIIYRDFKTSNILLDDSFGPKLSDFGLARLGPEGGDSHVTTAVVGTVGYAAPEYVHTGHLTAKSDVWSFGVVLLELLTGRKALDKNRPKNEQRLLEWVKPYISTSRKFHLIMDPSLEGHYPLQAAQKMASLAASCLTRQPKARPKMSELVEGLKQVLAIPVPDGDGTECKENTPQKLEKFHSDPGVTREKLSVWKMFTVPKLVKT